MSLVSSETHLQHTFSSAEMGAIAHLYRGEVYRSTIWRTRLDNTTNWAIVTMGIALSTTFSSPEASPLPLLLVGLLLAVFLGMEARRYRYFNVWRARARWLEMNFYAPYSPVKPATIAGRRFSGATTPRPATTFRLSARRGGDCVATTSGFSRSRHRLLRQDSDPPDACVDLVGICRSRRRRADPRLDRSDGRLCLQFRVAGVCARHDVVRPAPARSQGR